MVKPKSKLPKEQRCQFLIGPSSSWFLPNNTDIWTQLRDNRDNLDQHDSMDIEENASLSYFIYGSIGCYCYGEIHHYTSKSEASNSTSATLNRLIDVKEDNSRVICTRFLKPSRRPLALILTDNGSFLIHDCITSDDLVHFKKSELLAKFSSEPELRLEETSSSEHSSKKPRFDAIHQFGSCLWPSATNAFLGVSIPKKKINLVLWLKLKDLTKVDDIDRVQKNEIIESYEKLNLNLPHPICCMESVLIESKTCLIAVGMENGLIVVFKLNFELGQSERVITLERHTNKISSLSFMFDASLRANHPLGLLASASRNGVVVIWDIEDEFYFADYTTPHAKIDWFALRFISTRNCEQVHLAISNSNHGLTVLRIPKKKPGSVHNIRETKEKFQKKPNVVQQSLRHLAIIFNIVFDPMTQTLITTSIDGNILLWKCQSPKSNGSDNILLDVKPEYMYPTMSDNSRAHMIRYSPIRTDFMSLALGKSGVKFYKISNNHTSHRFDMSRSCHEIARRITKASLSPTSVAWHPNHEYRLAIGTLEGKVLRVDITPQRATLVESENKKSVKHSDPEDGQNNTEDIFGVEYKPLKREDNQENSKNSSETIKTDGIYSLCWGPNPCCPNDVSKLAIYAVGSIRHRLFIYENYNKKESASDKEKLSDYLDEFFDQSLPEAIGEASEVSWKASMDLMALGTTTGKIIIVSYLEESHADRSRNILFRKLAVIQGPLGHTYIQCLTWHPTTKEDDPHYYYIASSANESPVFVFNIKESLLVADVKTRLRIQEGVACNSTSSAGDLATSNIISTYVYKLDGHKKPISDVAWSPHKPNELATASFDRHCFIWSLSDSPTRTARVSAKFTTRNRLFTVEWSLIDEDLIFTSGQDSTIWSWRPSENLCKNEIPSTND